MSLSDCIDTAVAGGEMDAALGDKAKAMFEKLRRDYARKMAGPAADQAAADETLKALRFETEDKHRKERLQMLSQNYLHRDIVGAGDQNEGRAFLAALSFADPRDAHIVSAENMIGEVKKQAYARMPDFAVGTRRTITGGQRNTDQGMDFVRESFGQDTGNADVKLWFRQWSEAAEYLRQRGNQAGMSVGKIDGGYIPYRHDSVKIRKVPFEEWKQDALANWDIANMRDVNTGLPLPVSDLDRILKQVWDNITHDGWNTVTSSGAPKGQKFGARYAEQRFVKFKSPEAWRAYNEKYGDPNPFNATYAYIENMSRDIGLMERFGPNPQTSYRWARELIQSRAAARDAKEGGTKHMDSARSKLARADALWEHLTNSAMSPGNVRLANTMAGIKHWLVSAQLGSAFISSISDLNLTRLAAAHAGLPQWKTVAEVGRLFLRNSDEDRRLALRLGLIADGINGATSAVARMIGEVQGPETARRISDATMRLSGLSHLTRVGQWAFGMSFMGKLADESGRTFRELPDALRKTLIRHGFDEAAWDAVRATPLYSEGKATFLRFLDIEDPRLATRVSNMIDAESQFAVPTGTIRSRTLLLGATKPGTIEGEVLRAANMYKSFSIMFVFLHGLRALSQDTMRGKLSYAASLAITMTLMGGLSLQLKQIAAGRDPRAMFDKDGRPDPKFVAAAFMQGGGLGIYGDLAFSNLNRFGRSAAETVLGPIPALGQDTLNLTVGNLAQLATGDDTNFGGELVRYLGNYTPFAGSIWYGSLAFERAVLNQIQHAIDPQADRRFRNQVRRWQRDFGQEFWWKPGESTPDRAPDLAAAGG